MIISFSPQGNSQLPLSALSVSGDTLTINTEQYDLSGIPEGATLPDAQQATGCDLFRGSIERIDDELHVTLLLPHGDLPQPKDVLFPKPVQITNGEVELPYDKD